MAFPADRFTPAPTDQQLPLRLPATLTASPAKPSTPVPVEQPPASAPAPSAQLATSANGVDPVDLAVEFTRTVPASGNLGVGGQQFWLGPVHAGATIDLWADTTVVHLLKDGVRLKTVPSRLTVTHLRQLLTDGAHRAGPPPTGTNAQRSPGGAVEVDRTVNATGTIGLAGRQHPIGYHFAGRRIIARLDHGVLHICDPDGTLLRSLPNPLNPADLARLRDARPAGPAPTPPAGQLRVERRVSSRGAPVIAGQRVHAGITHAGKTLTVEAAETTFRVYDGDQFLTEVVRTTTKPIARFKAHKPEPPRRPRAAGTDVPA